MAATPLVVFRTIMGERTPQPGPCHHPLEDSPSPACGTRLLTTAGDRRA
jgi:hypothetical protein